MTSDSKTAGAATSAETIDWSANPDALSQHLCEWLELKFRKSVTVDQDLYQTAVINSRKRVRIVAHLRKDLGIPIRGVDEDPEHYRTVAAILALVAEIHDRPGNASDGHNG
jgi:acyl carrier protein